MTETELLQTMDASVWAKEFVRLHGGDEGLMLAWFANAIMCGYDHAKREEEALTVNDKQRNEEAEPREGEGQTEEQPRPEPEPADTEPGEGAPEAPTTEAPKPEAVEEPPAAEKPEEGGA